MVFPVHDLKLHFHRNPLQAKGVEPEMVFLVQYRFYHFACRACLQDFAGSSPSDKNGIFGI